MINNVDSNIEENIEVVTRLNYSSLQISLYFFLLIFFVLLVSSNKPNDEKSKLALSSIKRAFKISSDNVSNLNFLTIEKLQAVERIKSHYRDLIVSYINGDMKSSVVKSGLNSVLRLEVSTYSFFEPKDFTIKNDYLGFLTALATILNKEIDDYELDLNISIGCTNYYEKGNDKLVLTLNRIVEIENFLFNLQVNPDKISSQIQEDMSGRVILTFALNKTIN